MVKPGKKEKEDKNKENGQLGFDAPIYKINKDSNKSIRQ